jgi:hypothetical protein
LKTGSGFFSIFVREVWKGDLEKNQSGGEGGSWAWPPLSAVSKYLWTRPSHTYIMMYPFLLVLNTRGLNIPFLMLYSQSERKNVS